MLDLVKDVIEEGKANSVSVPQKDFDPTAVRIAVIGTGGAGCNSVSRITKQGIKSATTIAINTDAKHLRITEAHKKHVLGYKITKGLGAGGDPSVARKAAEADLDKLRTLIGENEIVFILAGMGGGTGTGSAPILARIAKEQGAIVVGVVTFPFNIERVRVKKAREGLNDFLKEADTVIVIDNNRLLGYAPNLPLNKALELADEVAARAVRGIADTIVFPSLMNVDYADVQSVMKNGGLAMISIGEANGPDCVKNVVENTMKHPLLDVDYEGAKGALIHIESGQKLTLGEAIEIGEGISSGFDEGASVKMGARINNEFMGGVRVTAIVTGVKSLSIFGQASGNVAAQGMVASASSTLQEGMVDEFL
ncbi:MAG: cell division protein FtsZ [Candidatus Micrarchaeia archaeon]|jgi:cell division protein FtsZ